MKKLTDKEIQELMDKTGAQDLFDRDDTRLYSKIYSALNEEVKFELPTNFAHSVANMVELNDKLRDLKIEKIWIGLGVLTLVISLLVVVVLLTVFSNINISAYLPMLALGSILILLIQYFDRKVKKLYFK